MTAALPWFRAYTEMVDDEKLRLLAFEDRWHFIALLCCKGAGLLDAGDPPALLYRKIAVKLGLDTRALEAVALRLSEVDLIDPVTFQPVAWEQRQMKSDRSTDRVAAFRERTKRSSNVTETAQDLDLDLEVDTDKSKKEPKLAPLRGTRLTQGWAPSDDLARWAIHQCADNPRAMLTEVDKFNDYWAGIAGAKGVKLDWDATFRNWIRKAADDINHRGTKHAAAHRPSAIERVEANIRAGQQRDGYAVVDGEAQRLIG